VKIITFVINSIEISVYTTTVLTEISMLFIINLLKITVVLDVTNSVYLSTSHPLSADYFLKKGSAPWEYTQFSMLVPTHVYCLNILYGGMVICNFLQLENVDIV